MIAALWAGHPTATTILPASGAFIDQKLIARFEMPQYEQGAQGERGEGKRGNKVGTNRARQRRSVDAVVEELLAGDFTVPVDGVEADLFDGLALAGGLARDVEGEVDGELVGAVEEGAADLLAVDRVIALPDLRLVNDGLPGRRSVCRRPRPKRCPARTSCA
jgi:hypothetical protein